jgi:hypothetical protein
MWGDTLAVRKWCWEMADWLRVVLKFFVVKPDPYSELLVLMFGR